MVYCSVALYDNSGDMVGYTAIPSSDNRSKVRSVDFQTSNMGLRRAWLHHCKWMCWSLPAFKAMPDCSPHVFRLLLVVPLRLILSGVFGFEF